ncbi:F-box protein [Acorus gramineus]|uniref:F-box protein n=1 Tax=Acorus gramineus TaxID=55184 RepID=A0AAV9AW40_ACOGR|nr:F-box protein [Acorus gramineus]
MEAMDWSDLPNDILYTISMRVDHLSDYIRFGAVCRSWRSAISDNHRHLPHHLRFPFLFLSSVPTSRDDHALYSPFERKVHPIRLFPDRVRKERCIGSDGGWVCMVDDNLGISLFNPFSSAVVLLPPLRTDVIQDPKPHPKHHGSLEFLPGMSGEYLRNEYTYKAVWSAEPTDPNCIVALLLRDGALLLQKECTSNMAYCRPGDTRWTVIETSFHLLLDAIFYKEDHRFYVVGCGYMGARVAAIGVLGEQEMELPRVDEALQMATDLNLGSELHLAATGGGPSGLVVVLRLLKNLNTDQNIPYRLTVGFKLFKLDETETKWVETTSLDNNGGDGNGMLFLGLNNSMWLSSRDFIKGFCQGNSVYFTDDDRFNSTYYVDLGGESGVFHLEDGSFGSIYGNDLKYLYPHPIWVLPNP